jgi:hypothetical protein
MELCSWLIRRKSEWTANIESLYNLEENLQSQGYDLLKIPYVLQLNKRDLGNIIPVEDLGCRNCNAKANLLSRP